MRNQLISLQITIIHEKAKYSAPGQGFWQNELILAACQPD